jgi:hypothetical protein
MNANGYIPRHKRREARRTAHLRRCRLASTVEQLTSAGRMTLTPARQSQIFVELRRFDSAAPVASPFAQELRNGEPTGREVLVTFRPKRQQHAFPAR